MKRYKTRSPQCHKHFVFESIKEEMETIQGLLLGVFFLHNRVQGNKYTKTILIAQIHFSEEYETGIVTKKPSLNLKPVAIVNFHHGKPILHIRPSYYHFVLVSCCVCIPQNSGCKSLTEENRRIHR